MSESTERAAPPARRPQEDVDDERDAPSDDLMCRVENAEGYGCTRVSGHRGDHIARSSPHTVCARWPAHPFVRFDPVREVAVVLTEEERHAVLAALLLVHAQPQYGEYYRERWYALASRFSAPQADEAQPSSSSEGALAAAPREEQP